MQFKPTDRKNAGNELMSLVTEKLVQQMEKVGTDWSKPFRSMAHLPINAITGEEYHGSNTFLLMLGTDDSEFAGYQQWASKGAQVRKGEKGHVILRPAIAKDKNDPDKTFIRGFYPAYVFGRSQVDNAPDPIYTEKRVDLTEAIQQADSYFDKVGATVVEGDGGRAFYAPEPDSITMPPRAAFTDTATSTATECYYGTLAHEHVHWTGRKTRLDRLKFERWGDELYAFEELVAEIGATFLCVKLGISNEPRADHAQYLNSWIKNLKKDPDALFKAASQAQKAVEYLDTLQASAAIAA